MSTQTKFDLDGLSHAIGARDARYQLALYADAAEVEIVDADHPAVPLQVLHGKADIATWLDSRSSGEVRHEVRDAVAQHDRVRFTEECWYPDGTDLRYECRADVQRGQIVHARVAVVCRPRPDSAVRPDQEVAASATDEDAGGRTAVSASTRTAALTPGRSLPGNFLG